MCVKSLTLEQRCLLQKNGLIPDQWYVISDDPYRVILLHRKGLRPKTVVKEEA